MNTMSKRARPGADARQSDKQRVHDTTATIHSDSVAAAALRTVLGEPAAPAASTKPAKKQKKQTPNKATGPQSQVGREQASATDAPAVGRPAGSVCARCQLMSDIVQVAD